MGDDRIAKLSDPNYLFLALRDPLKNDHIFLVVRHEDKWIEDFCFAKYDDTLTALRAVAPVVARNGWLKNYYWRDGFFIDSGGTVVSVNALPDTLVIHGDVQIFNETEVNLPDKMLICGTLTLHTSTFRVIPRYLSAVNVKVIGCTLDRVADQLNAQGDVIVTMSKISELAGAAVIRGNLELSHMIHPVQMPVSLRVGGNMSATSDIVKSFGADTVILGDMKIETTAEYVDFALDFTGRVLTFGDPVRIIDVPYFDQEGDEIDPVNAANAKGQFLGRFVDGTYACHLIDEINTREHPVSPLRHSIVAAS